MERNQLASCVSEPSWKWNLRPPWDFQMLQTPADIWLKPHKRLWATPTFLTHRDDHCFFFKQVRFGVIVTLRNTDTDTTTISWFFFFFFSVEGMERSQGLLTRAHSQSLCGWGKILQRTLLLIPQNIAPEVCYRIPNSISRLVHSLWWCDNTENYGVHFFTCHELHFLRE